MAGPRGAGPRATPRTSTARKGSPRRRPGPRRPALLGLGASDDAARLRGQLRICSDVARRRRDAGEHGRPHRGGGRALRVDPRVDKDAREHLRRDRSGVLHQNVYAAALLTVATSVAMGLLARSVAGLFGLATVSLWDLIVVALVGGVLSSAFVLAFTVYLSAASYRQGWDLDSVGATLITTVGDVVTLPCLLAASYPVHVRFVTVALGVLAVGAGVASVRQGWTTMRPLARRIFHESLPILCIAIVLDILAGTVAEPRLESFLAYNAFLVLLPGFLARTGALGSILSARLGSKLHLGAVTPRARPEAAALLDASLVFVLGISVYALAGVATLVLAEILGYSYPGVVRFLGVTLTGGILATAVASVIGYYAAVVAYRFGFDPDNHTIPVVTSGMDLLGVICLVVALVVFGVGS